MIDPQTRDTWTYRGAFLGVALFLLFLRLLPLGNDPGSWPGPDLLLCLILAWVVRRPDLLPVALIAAVVLMEDLILLRPPGLWCALVVLASEFLRSRAALTRELNFGTEWLLVAGLMLGLLMAYRLTFSLTMLPQPGFGYALIQTIWSILCYPAVVLVSRYAFALHKPATGEIDDFGRRL